MEGEYKYFWDDNGNLCRFHVEMDDMNESPREWSNVGTMFCWHRRHRLGDWEANNFRDEDEFLETMYESYVDEEADISEMRPTEMLRSISKRDVVILPVYLYDHSGLAMSTSDFGDFFDSGRVGWIYTTKEIATRELRTTEENWREVATERLKEEVHEYDMYLQNEVYWYCVEVARKDKWLDTNEEFYGDWGHVDSCGGFYSEKYGDDLLREMASEAGLNPDAFYDSEEEAIKAKFEPLVVEARREIA